MTSSTGPERRRPSISRLLPSRAGGRYSDPEERFQRYVTLGFIGLIVAVGAVVVLGLIYGFWDANFRPVASVDGVGISRAEYEERVRLEDFRLTRAEGDVRTALAEGSIDTAIANTRLTAISTAQQSLGASSLDRLVDLTLQRQLAEQRELTLTPEELDAALAAEGARPEGRHVRAIIIRPAGQAQGLAPTPEGRQEAYTAGQGAIAALRAGAPFDQVLRQFGTDGVEDGGDLGLVERSDLDDPAWAGALFALPTGGITDLVSAADGSYRIGTVTEVVPETPDPSYLADVERAVGASANRRNVELEAIAAKLEESVVSEALAGDVDQVHLAEILVEGDTSIDPSTDEGTIRASHILYAPNDVVPDPSAPLPSDDPGWETARADAQAAVDALTAIPDTDVRAAAFALRARAESDDPTAASVAGDLGFFTRATMVEEFATALFDDPDLEPGDLVGPVRSPFGWHVISFTDRRAPIGERLEEVEAALAAPDAEFATVARALSDGAEAPAGGDTGWHTLDELDAQTLEAIAPLAVGDRSEPLETERGFVIVQKLDEGRRPLDAAQAASVESSAYDDWYADQRFEAESDGRISQDALAPAPI
jgi:parvulin-like peptidyl-prolyl isomerase